MLAKQHPRSLVLSLSFFYKSLNAITSNTARGDWTVSPTRQEQQAAARKAGEQSCLMIKSPGSEGKKKKCYHFAGLEKSHRSLNVPWC